MVTNQESYRLEKIDLVTPSAQLLKSCLGTSIKDSNRTDGMGATFMQNDIGLNWNVICTMQNDQLEKSCSAAFLHTMVSDTLY